MLKRNNLSAFLDLWWVVTALICFFSDRMVKTMLVEGLWGNERILSWLEVRLLMNDGVAFGLGGGYGLLVSSLGLVIFFYFLFVYREIWLKYFTSRMGVGMVLGGVLSNMVDRLFYNGKVVDYIYVSFYSVFNLADVFIVVGLMIVLLVFWKDAKNVG